MYTGVKNTSKESIRKESKFLQGQTVHCVNLTPNCKIFAWEKLLLLNKCLHANIPIQIVINTLWYQKKIILDGGKYIYAE